MLQSTYMTIQEQLKTISTLRETKGKEQETLALISEVETEAISKNDFKTLVTLNWEKSLVWQHVAMEENTKESPNKKIIEDAYDQMGKFSLEAHKIIQEQNLTNLLATSHRFLGQFYRLTNKLDLAQEEYEKAIKEFESKGSAQSLEVKGFLSHVFILKGNIKEGLKLAVETFELYETYPESLELKKKDYFTYAVWRSGVFARIIKDLLKSGKEFDKELVKNYLEKSENLLKKPEGDVNWGDPNFGFRIDEIKKAKELLEK